MIRSVTPFGDEALLVDLGDISSAHRLADRLLWEQETGGAPASVLQWVVGHGTVVVHLEPGADRPEEVGVWLRSLGPRDASGGPGRAPTPDAPARVVIPATFDGPDLGSVARALGTTDRAVVASLCAVDLEVAFIGFAPGFPYLVGLPPELASVPRRSSPRSAVPAGSVAVAGGYASVYPQSTPGGWMLLGRTSVPLFDRRHPPFALLRPGDLVRFTEEAETDRTEEQCLQPSGDGAPDTRPLLENRGRRFIEVLEPGLLSLVEDQGRRSAAPLGVPGAGPADPEALRLGNRLVGNPDGAAAIEVTASGPKLRFHGDAWVTVVGAAAAAADVLLDGRRVDSGAVVPVGDGQVVSIGRVRSGLRAYVAVSGGVETPPEMGSRSSDVLCGLGPGALRAGDRLDVGAPSRPRGQLSFPDAPVADGRPRELRVLAGPHRLAPDRYRELWSRPWMVGEASNRIGLRLEAVPAGPDPADGVRAPSGPAPVPDGRTAPVTIPSTGMVTGAVQVPPDGNPIILMPDHATVGGYPVACCVITADLPVLGQLRPGDTVRLTTVDPATAREARERWGASLDRRVSGWFPTAAGT